MLLIKPLFSLFNQNNCHHQQFITMKD